MSGCVDKSATREKNSLVVLRAGIYTAADSGGKRVKIDKKTPGLVIKSFGNQVLVSISDDRTVLAHERACEKLQ